MTVDVAQFSYFVIAHRRPWKMAFKNRKYVTIIIDSSFFTARQYKVFINQILETPS